MNMSPNRIDRLTRTTRRTQIFSLAGLVLPTIALAGLLTGCAQIISMATQSPVREGSEWNDEGDFSFYVPENYDRGLQWPLVVLCHGEFPDSARSHIHYWTDKAEDKGFIVAAPSLKSPHSFNTGDVEGQLKRLRDDERRILDTVRRLRGAYSISEDRVFVHGWSAGAVTALHTALKHPDVFRGASVVQPRFEGKFLTDTTDVIDSSQPVFVDYGSVDSLTGNNASACIDWLYDHSVNVHEHSLGPARADTNGRSVSFYERIIRSSTWMHVRAFQLEDDDPLSVRFAVKTTAAPVRYRWDFGDGDQSPVAEPIHVFPNKGTFRVRVSIETEDGSRTTRAVDIEVPGARLNPISANG